MIGLAVGLVALGAFLLGRLASQDREALLRAELRARDAAEDSTRAWREAFFMEAVREQRLAGYRDGYASGWRTLRAVIQPLVPFHMCDGDCPQRAEHVPDGSPIGPVRRPERPS